MTIQQTLTTIRDLGLSARWLAATSEFRVALPDHSEPAAYYTNDGTDAVASAREMARVNKVQPK